MEAIAALGLASNVVQFVDFTTELLRMCSELRKGPSISEHEFLRAVTIHLIPIAKSISVSSQAISQSSLSLSCEQKALRVIADGCCELALNVQKRLVACGIPLQKNAGRIKRVRVAFKVLWDKSEVESMLTQLEHLRTELAFHMNFETWNWQRENQLSLARKDDMEKVSGQISQLQRSMIDLRLDLQSDADSDQIKLLQTVSAAGDKISQLHATASQQISTGLAAVDTSFENLKEQLDVQHSKVIESLAQANAENSQFRATMTTERESLQNSLECVLRSLLVSIPKSSEEYSESFIEKTRKEFRGTARVEFQHLIASLKDGAIEHQIHQPPKKGLAPFDSVDGTLPTSNEKNHMACHLLPRPNDIKNNFRDRLGPQGLAIAVDGQGFHAKVTRVGVFLLKIKKLTHLRVNQPASSVYELNASFTPAPAWLSTGMSIKYSRTVDGRGPPKFGLQLMTHRILADNHEIWNVIGSGNVSAIRTMLGQRMIFPSDRDDQGNTLLHIAALRNELSICKSLVQSGADTNAHNSFGHTPITFTLSPHRQALFYFLRSVHDPLEFLWDSSAQTNTALNFVLGSFLNMPEREITKDFPVKVQEWLSMCQGIESFDEDQGGELSLECDVTGRMLRILLFAIHSRGVGKYLPPITPRSPEVSIIHRRAVLIFNLLLESWSGNKNMCLQVPTRRAVLWLAWLCDHEKRIGRISRHYKPNWSCHPDLFIWHDYHVHRTVIHTLRFCEHVISSSIKRSPDSIFDSRNGRTAHEVMCHAGLEVVWAALLSQHGIDPTWVGHENEKRKETGLGNASAHEIQPRHDASEAQKVAKRKTFVSKEDE
ncbi:hypothetical protein F5Y16DRAFT_415893 [Xylariaceae sp. FL0255]|nr:hypothetical protein F5Y16DRAFT_415893 [Xylariaceae sp. FL0255]